MAPENKVFTEYLKTAADRENVCRSNLGEPIPYTGTWEQKEETAE